MDERFEALCEIGDLVINAGRHDLVETYYDLLCEHYPADTLTSLALGKVSSEEEESEESEDEGMRLELEPEPELKEIGEEVQEEEDDKLEDENVDYDSEDSSDSEGDLTDEEFEIKCDENGFLSLA
jgi:hypothetical protein